MFSSFCIEEAAHGIELTEIESENLHWFCSMGLGLGICDASGLPLQNMITGQSRQILFKRLPPQTQDLHGFFRRDGTLWWTRSILKPRLSATCGRSQVRKWLQQRGKSSRISGGISIDLTMSWLRRNTSLTKHLLEAFCSRKSGSNRSMAFRCFPSLQRFRKSPSASWLWVCCPKRRRWTRSTFPLLRITGYNTC